MNPATGPLPLMLAVLVPATVAAVVTLALSRPHERLAPDQVARGDPVALARAAEGVKPLRPIVLHGRRTTLGTGPAGPLTTARGAAVPVRLAIPELHVDAEIEPVRATPAGIEVPQIGWAGWFADGPRPGDPGRAVLIGHIDGATTAGVFENVPKIRTGAEIVAVDKEDGVHRYAVVGKLQVPKERFPADAVYGPSERPVLVLVTCGGVYVPGVGYSDNVIVYAREVA